MVGRKIETNKFFGLLFDRLSRGKKFKRHDQKEYRSGTILGCFRPFRTIERSLSHFFHILLITYAKSICQTTPRIVISLLSHGRFAISLISFSLACIQSRFIHLVIYHFVIVI